VEERAQGVPVLVLTSVDDEDTSLKALHKGAADYLVKSEVSANWLSRSILYAIERTRLLSVEEDAPEEAAPGRASLVVIKPLDASPGEYVATFTDRRLVSVVALERVKLRLFSLFKQEQVKVVHLDFSNVDYVANAAISMFLILHRKAASAGSKLILENVGEQVHEHFVARRFDRVFDIRRK
jgi:anti-anti-sigma regulatory factor